MFSKAVLRAQGFTRPVVTSLRFYDGTVEAGIASFVVLNDEGWIVTAAHVFGAGMAAAQHAGQVAAYESAKASGAKGGPKRDSKWITNHSYWWGSDGVAATNISGSMELDIAVAKLTPFDAAAYPTYPAFKDPTTPFCPGKSLCHLGFPFHEVKASFNSLGQFELAPGALPVPFFPNDGILTREAIGPRTSDGKFTVKFIETSSPGLRGQSGGPVFDTDGVVWGIQSRTHPLPLGFCATANVKGRQVDEQQFINVGLAVHPEVIAAYLSDVGVKFSLAA